MQTRERALHPNQVVRPDPDATERIVVVERDEVAVSTSRHRRPTVRMSVDEMERVVAETAPTPPRTRLARGSGQHDTTREMVVVSDLDFDLEPDPYPDPAFLLLPFRARRPVLATVLTAAFAAAFLLALHHIISAG